MANTAWQYFRNDVFWNSLLIINNVRDSPNANHGFKLHRCDFENRSVTFKMSMISWRLYFKWPLAMVTAVSIILFWNISDKNDIHDKSYWRWAGAAGEAEPPGEPQGHPGQQHTQPTEPCQDGNILLLKGTASQEWKSLVQALASISAVWDS